MRTVLLLFAAGILGASACSEPTGLTPSPSPAPSDAIGPDGLALTTDADAYARGDTAHVTLRNETDATYGMGVLGCATLERPAADGWERAPEGNDRACIQIYRTLAPGETMEADLPLDVSSGTYRIAHHVTQEESGTAATVATASFCVTG